MDLGLSKVSWALATCACILPIGCGPGKDVTQEFVSGKGPAYLRVANFGPADVTLAMRSAPPGAKVAPGDVGPFFIRGSAKQRVKIEAGDKAVFDQDLALDPGSSVTIVVTGKSASLYSQATRVGSAGSAAIRVLVVSGPAASSVQVDNQPLFGKIGSSSATEFKSVSDGDHKFTAHFENGKSAEVEGHFAAGDAYSIFITESNSKAKLVITHDSPLRKPIAGRPSAAG